MLALWSSPKFGFIVYDYPLPDDKNFRLVQIESICRRQIKFYSIHLSYHRIENIVGKEENAGNQHFLLFPQCFQNAFSSSASKVVIVW